MELKPGYKQTEVGVIPEEWEVKRLGDVATLKARIGWQGLTTAEYLSSGEHYLVTGTEFDGGYIDWSKCCFVDDKRYRMDRYIQLKVRDVLVTKDGTIGKVALVSKLPGSATLNSGVFVIRPINDAFSPEFFYYILCSSFFSDFLGQLAAGSTINHLYQKDFVNFSFSAPPSLSEQTAIATVLSDMDALLDSLDRLIAKKRDIKQAAMQELLTGKTRLPGFEGEWEVKRLGDIANIQRGASPRPIDSPVWFDRNSTVGWVRIADITNAGRFLNETTQRLSSLGVKESRPVAAGSLIMSICATVGRPIITNIDVCIHDGFVVFGKLETDQMFIYYVLKWIEPDWSKHGQTGSQMNLNTGLINGTKIKLPSLSEQTAIAKVLSDMDAEIEALEERRTKTQNIKQGMMQELLTGKTRLIAQEG